MACDLTDAVHKMRWTHHQLLVLNAAVAEYVYADPYVALTEDDPEARRYRLIARERRPPPAQIGLIASDFPANLQGALDFLAAQLVIRENGTVDHRTAFPIKRRLLNDGSEPPLNIRALDAEDAVEDPKVVAALRRVQPYKDGSDADLHPLQVLRVLNGHSKHRHIPVVTSFLGGMSIFRLPATFGGATNPPGGKDGTELDSVPYGASDGPPEYEVLGLAAQVALDRGGPADPLLTVEMWRLFVYVRDHVFGSLRRFFPTLNVD